ncbi:MAG TPA: NACHT domain-containing protein [Candidatus Limnocylindrales bacterium]|nr:NACHT domain-containing protein [Candidatus Limnocylindrales bacterium]
MTRRRGAGRRRIDVHGTGSATASDGGIAVSGVTGDITKVDVHLGGSGPEVPPTDVVLALRELVEPNRSSQKILDRAAAALAEKVERQWSQEAALQQLLQPDPLQVCWSSTRRPVSASREVVLDESTTGDWQVSPLAGKVDDLAAAFRGLPHRQLVVLGEAGAGKTVLAILLTVQLVKDVARGGPVPVLLYIASWDPAAEHIEAFLARRLDEEYPFLAEHAEDDQRLADLMVARGRVIPILDGLDELSIAQRQKAISALDRFAATGRPLIVTCRGREYEEAVGGGVVLSRAAVVEVEPVAVEQTIAFLSHPAPVRLRWQPVFAHLREHRDGPLAQVLSTPLMVTLARAAFRDPKTDPADLLKVHDRDAIAALLIDTFVDAAYQPGLPEPPMPAPQQRLRGYQPARARRSLSCLARILYEAGTRDLRWSHFTPRRLATPRLPTMRGIFARLAFIVALGVLGFAASKFWIHPGEATKAALLWIVAVTVLARIGKAHLWWPKPALGPVPGMLKASYIALRVWWPVMTLAIVFAPLAFTGAHPVVRAVLVAVMMVQVCLLDVFRPLWHPGHRPARWRRLRRLALGIAFGVAHGLFAGLLAAHLLVGLVGGVVAGLVTAAMPTVPTVPLARRTASSPRHALRVNHSITAASAVLHGLSGGVVFAVAAVVLPGSPGVLTAGLVGAAVFGLAAGLNAGLWPWLRFRLTHLIFATRGQLPWRLVAFVEDAHRRGVLRLAGTSWQFRHALLQDHLVRDWRLQRLRARADAEDTYFGGDLYAAQLARMLVDHHRIDELRARADARDRYAAAYLAHFLYSRGEVEELRIRAAAGDKPAARVLAAWLAEHGRMEEAFTALRVLAGAGDGYAMWRLADLLVAQGRVDEAVTAIRALADAGSAKARGLLADLLAGKGCVQEAIAILADRVGTDPTDEHATARLADLFALQDRMADLRSLARSHHSYVILRLAAELARKGQSEEVTAVLRAHADQNGYAEWNLAHLLLWQGRIDELRARAKGGDRIAQMRLIDLLGWTGQVQELTDLAKEDWCAAEWLADLLTAEGRAEEAIAMLQARVDDGEDIHVKRLAGLRADEVTSDEFVAMLQAQADDGHLEAAPAEILKEKLRSERLTALRWLNDLPSPSERVQAGEALARASAETMLFELSAGPAIENSVTEDLAKAMLGASEAGDAFAAPRLAHMLTRQRRAGEALALLETHAGRDPLLARQLLTLRVMHAQTPAPAPRGRRR